MGRNLDQRRVGPGIYLGETGLEVNRPEVLAHFGLTDTPDNWTHVQEAIHRQCRLRWPDVPIQED